MDVEPGHEQEHCLAPVVWLAGSQAASGYL